MVTETRQDQIPVSPAPEAAGAPTPAVETEAGNGVGTPAPPVAAPQKEEPIVSTPPPPATTPSNAWSETDDRALMLFITDAKSTRSKPDDADLLSDEDEPIWQEISVRFPGRTAINCLQRYARMKLSQAKAEAVAAKAELAQIRAKENNLTPGAAAGESADAAMAGTTAAESGGDAARAVLKRGATDPGEEPDSKKAKAEETVWTDEEIKMLREMVSQFPNCKYIFSSQGFICIVFQCGKRDIFSQIPLFAVPSQHFSNSKMERYCCDFCQQNSL